MIGGVFAGNPVVRTLVARHASRAFLHLVRRSAPTSIIPRSHRSRLLHGRPSEKSSNSARYLSCRPTIFALSSGSLPAGVAVLRISGPRSLAALKAVTKREGPFEAKKLFFTRIYDTRDAAADGVEEVLDRAMAVWLPGPKTFTGEDTVELFLHGSRAVVESVCAALKRLDGFEHAKAGEFTKRAFYNDKMNLAQVEALNDLVNAETDAQRRLALQQNDSGRYLLPLRDALIGLIAQLEAIIDFAEDLDNQKLGDLAAEAESIRKELRKFLRGAERGCLIREGICVALVGKTNVGKSSLMNRLAERDVAIVSDISGTTRDFLETRLHLGGVPVTITDTAGIRVTEDPLELEGIRRSVLRASEANLVVCVLDVGDFLVNPNPDFLAQELMTLMKLEPQTPVLICVNKADLLSSADRTLFSSRFPEVLWTSTIAEQGLEPLLSSLQQKIGDLCSSEGAEMVLSRPRHVELLARALSELEEFQDSLDLDRALAAQNLRNAADAVGEISGAIVNEAILDRLFGTFCIGK